MTRMMQTNALTLLSASPRLPLIAALAVRFAGVVTQWDRNRRTRKDLKHLDDHLLKDIGLSRIDARRESALRFWQV